ncbi:MAG: hypothetical protein ACK53L_33680, partial [Pirellulaceae bacterium]
HYASTPGLRSRSLGSMSDGCHLPVPTTCSLAKRCVRGTYYGSKWMARDRACSFLRVFASPREPWLIQLLLVG